MDTDDEDHRLLSVMEKLDGNVNNSPSNTSDSAETDVSLPLALYPLSQFDNTPTNHHEPTSEHLKCLLENFGHSEFRPLQWQIIRSIIEDKVDNCVVMATGYGKSLCFQYPSVYLNGITIVVSPLISLMQDQVLSLSIANIPACLLGTAQSNTKIIEEVLNGNYRLVYLSPEYASTSWQLFEQLQSRLTLVAIDEAHCVSQWGHDFRTTYRTLDKIRQLIPSVPILAVTATATKHVREDICNSLRLREPRILCSGFDRPNLEFAVRPMKDVWEDLRPFLATRTQGSIIVYCLTRKLTENICAELRRNNVDCDQYHAGMGIKERKKILEAFVRDKLHVICATIAFGMGIDKPDVRYVIHYGASKDVEGYYQEVGRAGRDGGAAKCLMFFSKRDFEMHKFMDEKVMVPPRLRKHKEDLRKHMEDYCYTTGCRRKFILDYFEGTSNVVRSENQSNCCDNCRRGVVPIDSYEGLDENGLYDFSKDAKLFCNALALLNGYSGLKKPIDILRGVKHSKLEQFYNHQLFGIGKFKSTEYWNCLIDQLDRANFFIKTKKLPKQYYDTVRLSAKADLWLTSDTPLKLKPIEAMYKFIIKKKAITEAPVSSNILQLPQQQDNSEELLRKSLLQFRTDLAVKYDYMPYMIASNQALEEMAKYRPLNLEEMRRAKIDGMSEAKIVKFGMEFISCIMKWKRFLDPEIGEASIEEKNENGIASIPSDLKTFEENGTDLKQWYTDEEDSDSLLRDVVDESPIDRIDSIENYAVIVKNEIIVKNEFIVKNEIIVNNKIVVKKELDEENDAILSNCVPLTEDSIFDENSDDEMLCEVLDSQTQKIGEPRCSMSSIIKKKKSICSKRIQYANDSDDSEDDVAGDMGTIPTSSPKRTLPGWLASSQRINPLKRVSGGVKKRNIF